MKESGIFAWLFQNIIIRKYLVFTWNVSFFLKMMKSVGHNIIWYKYIDIISFDTILWLF